MNKRKTYKWYILLFSLIIYSGCSTDIQQKVYKKEYYNSGKLKREGWYINDSIPIDTIRNYYENGILELLEVRNDSGYYNGLMRYYYEDGVLKKLTPYKDNLQHGFNISFFRNGNIKSKGLWYKGVEVGDQYFYDSILRNVSLYNFRNYQGTIGLVQYDPYLTKITKDVRPLILIDSMQKKLTNNTDKFTYNILLFMSNPPYCTSKVILKYQSKNNAIIDSTIIENVPYFVLSKILNDSVKKIVITTIQYDSLIKENIYQENSIQLDSIKSF